MARKPSKARDPFDVDLSDAQRAELTEWLVTEIEAAYNARVSIIGPQGDIEYWHWLYEQGRAGPHAGRWPGAADLASWIPTEKVDALRARIMRTIFTEPVWSIEGWGRDAARAPFVEEFHQWKLEDERLQSYLSRALTMGLIEGNGILEVVDRHDCRLVNRVERYAAKLATDGALLLGDDNKPQIDLDEQGVPKPAVDGQAVVEASVKKYETTRRGPGYRVISLRDFLYLPGHAADKTELFGYVKRFWRRVSELKELEKKGVYQHLELLSETSDRTGVSAPNLERMGQQIAEQRDGTNEKELWEALVLKDLDGDGIEEWYVATVSTQHRAMIRLKHEDLGQPRYLDLCPLPREDSVYGYSYVGNKLITVTEEHTAQRNMAADRSTLATLPPVKRVQGALWNPKEQPFGVGAVIDVRDPNEVQAMTVPDVPASAFSLMGVTLQAAERLAGMNDMTSSGVTPEERTTATQIRVGAEQSFVRVEEVVKNVQEPMEDLWKVRQELWIRALESQPEGIEAPERIVRAIETRGLTFPNGRFTAALLRGNFRGKPRGSVETADKTRNRMDFNGSLQALAAIAKMFPAVLAIFQNPEAAKAVLEQWARLYNVPDRQAFLGSAGQPMPMPGMPPGLMPPGGPPGMAPGMGGPPMMGPRGPMAGGPAGGDGIDRLLAALPPQLQALLMQAPQEAQ